MIKRTIYFTLLVFLVLVKVKGQENYIFNSISPSPKQPAFEMEGYWVWCGSVVKGEDNQYHMFASRWPKILPFHPGWIVASEVIRATSKTAEGPYQFKEVVLPARGAQYWDGRSTHNPSITKYKDTYVLFYMGSTHPFADAGAQLSLQSPETIVGRSNKRIGIATSKSINGPWLRQDMPILNVKPKTFYSFLTSNPAPLIRKDGSVLLVFKGRSYGDKFPFHSKQAIGIAAAKNITGPYNVLNDDKPIFSPTTIGEVEDPFLWEDGNGLNLIVKDMSKKLTGEFHAGVLLHSNNGVDWLINKNPKAYSRTIYFKDGTSQIMGQLERPFILFEHGKPTYIFFATMDGKGGFENGTKSWNMVVPLKKD